MPVCISTENNGSFRFWGRRDSQQNARRTGGFDAQNQTAAKQEHLVMKISLSALAAILASASLFSNGSWTDVTSDEAHIDVGFCERLDAQSPSESGLPQWVFSQRAHAKPDLIERYRRADLAFRSAELQVRLKQAGSATLQAASDELLTAEYQLKADVCAKLSGPPGA